ncbi:MAG: hypothetical protein HUU20_07155 [Pirellulales bacterium]|nr:hypothetical protein [Pirellulales bacterium]
MKTLRRGMAAACLLVAVAYFWYRYQYPHGYNHCCDKALYLALLNYAAAHEGAFPAGESTPEASLSLVYRWSREAIDAHTLAGKTGSTAATQSTLDRGELLGPDTCGWNYVEGLRLDSNPRLALFWDKDGLGHDSQRLPGGGHEVYFLSGEVVHIPESEWSKFRAEQHTLLDDEKRSAEDKRP